MSELYNEQDGSSRVKSPVIQLHGSKELLRVLRAKSNVYVGPETGKNSSDVGSLVLYQKYGSHNQSYLGNVFLGWIDDKSLTPDKRQMYKHVEAGTQSNAKEDISINSPPVPPSPPFVTTGSHFMVALSTITKMKILPPKGRLDGSITLYGADGDAFPTFHFVGGSRSQSQADGSVNPKSGRLWSGEDILSWLRMFSSVESAGIETMFVLNSLKPKPKPEPKPKEQEQGSRMSHPPFIPVSALEMQPQGHARNKSAVSQLLDTFSGIPPIFRRAAQKSIGNSRQNFNTLQIPEIKNLQEEYSTALLYLAKWTSNDREMNAGLKLPTTRAFIETELHGKLGSFQVVTVDATAAEGNMYQPVTIDEWNSWFHSTGYLTELLPKVKERIFHGGLSEEVRPLAWPFLLGVYDWWKTTKQRNMEFDQERGNYQKLKDRWTDFFFDGCPDDATEEQKLKYEAWSAQRQQIEKDVHRTDREVEPFNERRNEDTDFETSVNNNIHLDQCRAILLTYNEVDPQNGYVQGMSDLLAPLYAILQDDCMTFWCFVSFMVRMEPNFRVDQTGMKFQLDALRLLLQFMDPDFYAHLEKIESIDLFFMYRMMLVRFKRELGWDKTLRLWEATWTDYLTSSFHIFFGAAIMMVYRSEIIEHVKAFDQMIKFANNLQHGMDLPLIMQTAEDVFKWTRGTLDLYVYRDGALPALPSPKPSVPLDMRTLSDQEGEEVGGSGVMVQAPDLTKPPVAFSRVRRNDRSDTTSSSAHTEPYRALKKLPTRPQPPPIKSPKLRTASGPLTREEAMSRVDKKIAPELWMILTREPLIIPKLDDVKSV